MPPLSPHPFQISVPDEAIEDLHLRLERTRWPDQIGADWEYGTPVRYLRELCETWRTSYCWRHWEALLNSQPQYQMNIEGLDVHFIHHRSSHPDARPLMVMHGWPSAPFEFHKVLEPLTEPQHFGADPRCAFHVVCPSIPGFGFSEAPKQPGFDTRATARIYTQLMHALGYSQYYLQGGDLGAGIALKMGRLDRESVKGIHLSMALVFAPKEDPMRGVRPEELQRLQDTQDPDEGGYIAIQETKPQTLGYGLDDSPAGMAAWIVEKFHSWSEPEGDVEACISRDEILTLLSINWFGKNMTSSARYYYEYAHATQPIHQETLPITAPISFALFPKDVHHPPRAWAERQYSVARWTHMKKGGHFSALEVPELWIQDVRASFW